MVNDTSTPVGNEPSLPRDGEPGPLRGSEPGPVAADNGTPRTAAGTPHTPDPLKQRKRVEKISKFWPVLSGIIAIAVAIVLGLIIFLRKNTPYEADTEFLEELIERRNPVGLALAEFMTTVGGGYYATIIIPAAVIIILLLLRRKWSALYYVAATVLSTVIVLIVKSAYSRPRPEEIFNSLDAGSFPSGHTANAATLAVIVALIIWRWWAWAAAAIWIIGMALARTYLGQHWLSDTVGGMLIGVAVAVIVWTPFADRMRVEAGGKKRVASETGETGGVSKLGKDTSAVNEQA